MKKKKKLIEIKIIIKLIEKIDFLKAVYSFATDIAFFFFFLFTIVAAI